MKKTEAPKPITRVVQTNCPTCGGSGLMRGDVKDVCLRCHGGGWVVMRRTA